MQPFNDDPGKDVGSEEQARSARREIVLANLHLVVRIAGKHSGRGVEFNDLLQEGAVGLAAALDTGQRSGEGSFLTWVSRSIRQAVRGAIARQGHAIPVPIQLHEIMERISRFQRRFLEEVGREPGDEEIAEGLPMSRLGVQDAMRILAEPISIEELIGDEGEQPLQHLLRDPNGASPEDAVLRREREEAVEEALSSLTPRDAAVLESRFGLGGRDQQPLHEIGWRFHLSRERIRQIETHAMSKLRHRDQECLLRPFLEELPRADTPAAIRARVATWSQRLRVRPRQVRIHSRLRAWGSCSAQGTVTLAGGLMDRSAEFQDAVIVHLLLRILSGSSDGGRRFRVLMTKYLPGWNEWSAEAAAIENGGRYQVTRGSLRRHPWPGLRGPQ